MKRIYQILLLCALFGGVIACENETKVCDQTLRTDIRVAFKRDSAGIIRDTIMPKVTLKALDRDTLINRARLGVITFPLSPTADSSRFHLRVDSALIPDTLTFRYVRKSHFISPGCGFGTYFNIDTVITTRNTILSVQINNKSVTSSDDTHLTLYFSY
ncbi:DUF6452 family protein [Chitinophaga nivalis]|uniref:DUF6452 family protein n=1 Tax=Chitinophaga nivalis TaxID=2991709 RepID=A0ABT3ITS8_9BACT|nr:DUF6452 family protein [Chitinophaga nivalis]MCW3462932.1 DUF6452 family protein [Chitinophaga nivalis]MCW3487378.1 DUF6452 family protein [Chitinophaga nivalis]